ncbi:helix-turn-helix domain-containing protein [Pseudomonas sp. R2.Fl]|nr:helix-turn-helix domain-containing protein [Pseudomonas sp. R2.Fl]
MLSTNYTGALATRNAIHANETNCFSTLFAGQPAEHLAAGCSLFFQGDEASHVFEVLEGTLRVCRIISDGRRIITGFLTGGDLIGVSLRRKYLYSVEAITPCTLRRMPRRRFETAVAQDDELRPAVFARVCDEMAAAQDQMVLLSCKNAEERLCSFFVKYMRQTSVLGERRMTIALPMSRQDMADYLGLTIETVSRTMTKLINKGVLSIESPGARHSITIERPGLLEQLAGDSDEYEEAGRDLIVHGERRRH